MKGPTLIYCSAGIGRTGKAVSYIKRKLENAYPTKTNQWLIHESASKCPQSDTSRIRPHKPTRTRPLVRRTLRVGEPEKARKGEVAETVWVTDKETPVTVHKYCHNRKSYCAFAGVAASRM